MSTVSTVSAIAVTRLGQHRPAPFSAMLVCRHAASRAALGQYLSELGAGPIHLAGSAGEALLVARTWGPCALAVLDADLPGEDVLLLLDELSARGWPDVLVQVDREGSATATRAMHSGARGILVAAGRSDPGRAAPTTTATPPPCSVRSAGGEARELSGRERQVLQLVAEGMANNAIGSALGLSGLTVKSHLSRISRKLGSGDRAQLAALALRSGAVL